MAFLKTAWDRVRSLNRPRESVDLNPVEQIVLRHLLHHGPNDADKLHDVVSSARLLIDGEFEDGLAHLVEAGLVEASVGIEPGRPPILYAPTRKSAILKDRIPQDPRGVTEYYL